LLAIVVVAVAAHQPLAAYQFPLAAFVVVCHAQFPLVCRCFVVSLSLSLSVCPSFDVFPACHSTGRCCQSLSMLLPL
jgi:hypothetical protein